MVVLLEHITSDFRQALRADKARSACRLSGSCRSGAATSHQEPRMTTATPHTEPERTIDDARERIDALDDRIIGLVQERMAVSAVVQQTRITSGGRRVSLSREMEILGRYRDALGKPGTALAMTLLELCRGRI
ncbi:chorismate mutase [Streptomyces griseoluteus]|uniref:Chorismate mutase n=2 Tax=Streptomyces griseoluteus TaxID=29306 RepID=A0A4Z1DT88_STRGP|nr:chorismate mutase [Streptomyces griseoluteus]